ncbi:MAG: universal stress protein [Chloroflexi bacterium]|nr:universal stress protein [Chloroflexota bacterium]
MYEKILVPLDGSKVGEGALPKVEELVGRLTTKVEVTLLQVISAVTHYVVADGASVQVPYTDKEMEQIKAKALEYLEKAGEGIRAKGATVKTKVSVGHPAEEILKASDEVGADVIAMSTHGRSGISRWAFGSVTDRVLRAGNKPMLLVRSKETK